MVCTKLSVTGGGIESQRMSVFSPVIPSPPSENDSVRVIGTSSNFLGLNLPDLCVCVEVGVCMVGEGGGNRYSDITIDPLT